MFFRIKRINYRRTVVSRARRKVFVAKKKNNDENKYPNGLVDRKRTTVGALFGRDTHTRGDHQSLFFWNFFPRRNDRRRRRRPDAPYDLRQRAFLTFDRARQTYVPTPFRRTRLCKSAVKRTSQVRGTTSDGHDSKQWNTTVRFRNQSKRAFSIFSIRCVT